MLWKLLQLVICLSLVAVLLAGCGDSEEETLEEGQPMELVSPAFASGEPIPDKYSGDGEDVSPPLQWSAAPQGTKSLALICDDPDAPGGTWVHWVVYNLPPETSALAENADANLPSDALHGKNNWGRLKYNGPKPPSGTHRYFFKLYAMDTVLNLKDGASKNDLIKAMQGHILGQAETMGVYSKK
jgi:Raf kinase inhibitor-like YbhB/YbcL family protein